MTQENEIRIKGQELAIKFNRANSISEITLLGEFYEWLIQQGDLLTREDHLDQLREAEQDGYEEAQESAAYQRENMREEG